MDESILITIKKMLGLSADYDAFDLDIMVYVNSALMVANQLGIGPPNGFRITGPNELWSDFIDDSINLESVKEMIAKHVQLSFDPPSNSFVATSMENRIKELEWRLNVQAEANQNEQ